MSLELLEVLEDQKKRELGWIRILHRLAAQNLARRMPDGREYMEACFIRADAEALYALEEAGRVRLLDGDFDRYAIAVDVVDPWSGKPADESKLADMESISAMRREHAEKTLAKWEADGVISGGGAIPGTIPGPDPEAGDPR